MMVMFNTLSTICQTFVGERARGVIVGFLRQLSREEASISLDDLREEVAH